MRPIADYVTSARLVACVADYVVVNVSSPNTPGLRDLQAVSSLRPLLTAVRAALDGQGRPQREPQGPEAANGETAAAGRRVPLLVKIAPDLADDDVDAIADLAVGTGPGRESSPPTPHGPCLSWLATRCSTDRRGRRRRPVRRTARGSRALEVLRRLHARVGDRLVLIAAGGIETADDAWEPHRRRRHPGPGLHRLHLRRAALAAPDPGRAGPAGAGRGAEVGQ